MVKLTTPKKPHSPRDGGFQQNSDPKCITPTKFFSDGTKSLLVKFKLYLAGMSVLAVLGVSVSCCSLEVILGSPLALWLAVSYPFYILDDLAFSHNLLFYVLAPNI